jgi:hypothetical protein
MEQSEQQKAILELGSLLVKELDLEKSVDTLSRWMAHYVAEKIQHVKSLPAGIRKKNAEKECFSLILDLWKHRWHFKPDRQPLRYFNHLFRILENLDPEKGEPYYIRLFEEPEEKEVHSFKQSDFKNLSTMAFQIDRVARIWIDYLLREAAAEVGNKKAKKLIKNAVKLPDATDARIIQIVFSQPDNNDDSKQIDKQEWNRNNKISILERRIGELRKFKEVNEYLITQYEGELKILKR